MSTKDDRSRPAPFVSPYLLRPLRTYEEYLRERRKWEIEASTPKGNAPSKGPARPVRPDDGPAPARDETKEGEARR